MSGISECQGFQNVRTGGALTFQKTDKNKYVRQDFQVVLGGHDNEHFSVCFEMKLFKWWHL